MLVNCLNPAGYQLFVQCDRLGEGSLQKDCCWGLTFGLPESTLKMTDGSQVVQVVEMSVTNNSLSKDHPYLDDHAKQIRNNVIDQIHGSSPQGSNTELAQHESTIPMWNTLTCTLVTLGSPPEVQSPKSKVLSNNTYHTCQQAGLSVGGTCNFCAEDRIQAAFETLVPGFLPRAQNPVGGNETHLPGH